MRRAARLFALALLLACEPAGERPAPDPLTVVDGDTVTWRGATMDLFGVDAPELGQGCLNGKRLYDCGIDAASELAKRVALDHPTCHRVGRRELTCDTGAETLAEQQIVGGWAYAARGAHRSLMAAEARAREAGVGVWRGTHIAPAAWREGARLPEEAASPHRCPVLTTRVSGRRYYLVPTDEGYEKVRDANATRYCSDEAAREAGLSRPLLDPPSPRR